MARETDGAVRDVVVGTGGIYRIDENIVEVDYWSFRRLNSLGASDELARLCRGDLAENLTALWLDGPRIAVRRQVLDVLGELISDGEKDCFPAVLRILDQVRTMDPYNEALYRDIIRVQVALGKTEGARETFAILAASMKELGCEVSRETIEFLARMKTPSKGTSRRAAS
ncbi:BTAD domain-containing putative transcriptional regulator [Kibdelosporangium lantanae]|uniref:BTAD domain-containing putative transcriptional regulator n=1 Tax=Kibdelosporangium lantanae TaxID=1497396 RepID=A0ABW3M6I0_9PSEU